MDQQKPRLISIVRNLTFALITTIVIVSIAAIGISTVNEYWRSKAEQKTSAGEAVEYLVNILELPMWNIDTKTIEIIGKTFSQNQNISYLSIRGFQNKEIFQILRSPGKDDLQFSKDIFHGGEWIGKIDISFSPAAIIGKIVSLAWNMVIISLLIIAAIFLVTNFLIGVFLKKPIQLFSNMVHSYAGDLTSFKKEKNEILEFASFSEVLEQMSKKISKQIGDLKELNGILEQSSKEKDRLIEEIHVNEKKYSSLFETAEDAIFIIDFQSKRILDVNPAVSRLYGYSREELLKLNADDVSAEPRESLAAIESKTTRIPLRYHKKKDGTAFPVEISVTTYFQGGREIVVGFVRDMTEKMLSESLLVNSEERFKAIMDQTPDIISILDEKGNLLYNSPATFRVHGYTAGDLIGKNTFDFIHPDDRESVARKFRLLLDHPLEMQVSQYRYLNKDGSYIWMEAIGINKLQNLAINGIITISRDITDRKQAEENIRNSLKEKETLLRELYHRTKNNMQVICSLLELQAMRVGDERLKTAFKDMENRIQSMALVHQKLYQSKNLSSINLKDYLSDLSDLLFKSYHVGNENIRLTKILSDVNVLIDTAIPCGLLVNELISNSLKHAFRGLSEGEITLFLNKTEDGRIEISVSDNGNGMPEGFDWEKASSMGLQTIITLSRMQLHGEIDIQNNHGTYFRVRFLDNQEQEDL